MRGPFSEAELVEKLGPLFVVSNRFGITQKGSVRVIDDLSDSMVNACFGASEMVDLGGVDAVVVLARSLLSMVDENRKVSVK